MDQTDISRLVVGQEVDGVFVLKKLVERDNTGNPFLLFQFGNATGTLNGILWGRIEPVAGPMRVNDLVHVRGEIQEYQGGKQVKVFRIDAVENGSIDRTDFLPRSSRDAGSVMAGIREKAGSVVDADLQALVRSFFEDEEFLEAFGRAAAGKAWHHSTVGGLAEHVHDMLQLAEAACVNYPELDRDLLMTGILLHDIGKLSELELDGAIQYTDEGRLLGHILIGLRMVDERIAGLPGFPQEKALAVRHLIASHQGRGDQGSPKVPMTLEALVLHFIDNLDAQVTGARQVIRGHRRQGGAWTEYVKLLDRAFYLGRKDEPR